MQARLSLFMSKCHIVGNLMSRLTYFSSAFLNIRCLIQPANVKNQVGIRLNVAWQRLVWIHRGITLTLLCRMDFLALINWTSPFLF